MKKKIGKLMVAISIIAFAVSGASQADPITVPNFSFELDENGIHIIGFVGDITADSLAWNEVIPGSAYMRPFIRCEAAPYVPDGDSYLMMKDDDRDGENYLSLTWQILTGETIVGDDTYLLTFNAIQHGGSGGNVLATLVYDDGTTLGGATIYGETFTITANDDPGEPWDEFMVSFTVPTDATYIGEDIGIKFEQTIQDWAQVDNVRLELIPEPMTIALFGLGALGMLRRRKI